SEAGIRFHDATSGIYISTTRHDKRAAGLIVDDSRLGQHFYRKGDRLREIAIHETAHHLDSLPFSALATVAVVPSASQRPPWLPCHCERFVRAAMHLLWRARRMGFDLDADGVLMIHALWDGFSSGEQYASTIRDEAER